MNVIRSPIVISTVLLSAMVVSWSSGFIGYRYVADQGSVYLASLWRFILAAAVLLPFARAAISSGGIFSVEIWKCSSERCVCAPQSRSAGTSIGPKLSRSILLLMASLSSMEVDRVYSRRQKDTG